MGAAFVKEEQHEALDRGEVPFASDVHPKDYELGTLESRAAARALVVPRRRIGLIIGIYPQGSEPVPADW